MAKKRNMEVKDRANEMLAKIIEYSYTADKEYHEVLMCELASSLITHISCGYDNKDDGMEQLENVIKMIIDGTIIATVNFYDGKQEYKVIGEDV